MWCGLAVCVVTLGCTHFTFSLGINISIFLCSFSLHYHFTSPVLVCVERRHPLEEIHRLVKELVSNLMLPVSYIQHLAQGALIGYQRVLFLCDCLRDGFVNSVPPVHTVSAWVMNQHAFLVNNTR